MEEKRTDPREMIACNIAAMLQNGDFVNLGIGIPTLTSKYVPEDVTVLLHGENGYVGQDKVLQQWGQIDPDWPREHCSAKGDWKEGHVDLASAGGDYISLLPGGFVVDSAMSFALARGGHLDVTVLGGLQVDVKGNLANWVVPGGRMTGMGGAMDLVAGAKKVIVAMEHCAKDGSPKLVEECTMPLTGKTCVDTVVTEKAVIRVTEDGFLVTAMAPGVTKEELTEKTAAPLAFAEDMAIMRLPE